MMMQQFLRQLILLTTILLMSCWLIACEQQKPSEPEPADADATLELIQQWVYGKYNNTAQAEADTAAELPPEQMHRPMYQLFARVDAPQLDGYILYQQSSIDGSETPAMIFRHGLMQYLQDPESGIVRQRELYFKEAEPYKNAHNNPEILVDVTPEQLTWDEGCDFFLTTNNTGNLVSGPLLEGKCILFNQGLQKNMYADDLIEITPTEYRFRGRYIDAEGNTLWGTESAELNTLIRQE
jgi:hypothetical protein